MELRHWKQSDAMELTSMCNAVDRHYLSDRLPNPILIQKRMRKNG